VKARRERAPAHDDVTSVAPAGLDPTAISPVPDRAGDTPPESGAGPDRSLEATYVALQPPPSSERPKTVSRDAVAMVRTKSEGSVASGTPKRPTPAVGDSDAAAGPLGIGQQFGRYTIIRLLGEGGMGAVYQAWDEELEVPVALKVVRPEIIADPKAARQIEQRFKRELLLARQVTHRNVVRIHDLGDIQGIKYITMSYVQGVDLATLLRKEGPLPIPRALRIFRGVVAGLQAAHEAGVVHRDLKPANIMVENRTGEALIMDFGVARLAGAEGHEPHDESGSLETDFGTPSALTHATLAGTVVGTLGYMAPEQGRAEDVDGRADLYSLGLIVYDMLLGRKRFEGGAKPVQELMKRQAAAPPSLRTIDPEIPEALDAVVMRSLQPKREDRQADIRVLAAEVGRLDEEGHLLPTIRRLTGRMIAAAAAVLVALAAGTWWYVQRLLPDAPHDPVSVVIADIQNGTNDAAFDGALAPILKLALEEAEFVSAYDRLEIRRTLGVPPPDTLDETSARELAVNQGLGVVLSGSLTRQGSRYELSMRAVETVTGDQLAAVSDRTSDRDQVLAMTAELAGEVREALGDDPSESARRFAQETLSVTSLEAVAEYAGAMEALSRGGYDDALRRFSSAVALDPNFGLAYAGMAVTSRNLDRQADAEKYLNEAVGHLESMTERERYRTRGLFYGVTGDYKACVKEYGDLIARYAGDTASRNNLALCASFLRDWPTALREMRQLVEMVPARDLYRENLATYLSYAGNFQAGEEAALQESGVFGLLALAFARLGQDRLSEAAQVYRALGEIDALGASYRASGLADIARYEGRFADAVSILREGAVADLMAEEPDRASRKLVELAHTYVLGGELESALAAAEEALAASRAMRTRFLAARVFIEAGDVARARGLGDELASEFQAESQTYARIIEGEAALQNGNARQAIAILTEANELLDTWIGHFDLGRAYLAAGAYLQAEGEFDRCLTRRGEAIALFLDEEPTYGYFPPVYYYQGRVREGLKNAGSAESYRRYLAIRGNSAEDPLLPEVRQRAGL
jgi:tetratricopeptide (TPR) repeat protein